MKMKRILDWQKMEVVNIFDEATLWAAPFGRLLLENIPMKPKSQVLDIGFGTGLPLIELSQRFGEDSTIYGIDIWKEGIERTKEKIRVFELNNIQIFEESATTIPLEDNSIDLVCSNLGVNNFEEKEKVLREVFRVLKKGGSLCITTNPIGTFDELFQIMEEVISEMQLTESKVVFKEYIQHRGTEQTIMDEIEAAGFETAKIIADETNMRFVNAAALFDHILIRIGFRTSWEKFVSEENRAIFFQKIKNKIEGKIKEKGEFNIVIPMLYFQFLKT